MIFKWKWNIWKIKENLFRTLWNNNDFKKKFNKILFKIKFKLIFYYVNIN